MSSGHGRLLPDGMENNGVNAQMRRFEETNDRLLQILENENHRGVLDQDTEFLSNILLTYSPPSLYFFKPFLIVLVEFCHFVHIFSQVFKFIMSMLFLFFFLASSSIFVFVIHVYASIWVVF